MIQKRFVQLLAWLLGLGILLVGVSYLGAEVLWFQSVGYLPMFLLRLGTQGAIASIVMALTAVYLLGNLALAQRLKYANPAVKMDGDRSRKATRRVSRVATRVRSPHQPPRLQQDVQRTPLQLRSLLPLSTALSVLIGFLLMYYGQLALNCWYSESGLINPVVQGFEISRLRDALQGQLPQLMVWAGVPAIAVGLLIYPRLLLPSVAIALSLLFGSMFASQWGVVQQYFHATPFNATDPLFGRDISAYIFSLPFWELVNLWLLGLFLYGFAAVTLTYLLSADSLNQGVFPGLASLQQRHVYGVSGCLMVAIALSYWLAHYKLLYSPRGAAFGASYSDVYAQLPAYIILCLLSLAIAVYFLWRAIFWQAKSPHRHWVIAGLGLYGGVTALGLIAPVIVQYLIVQPNELAREQPYIQRTIALTRQAFGLAAIDSQTFNPQGNLTEAKLAANPLTIRNIRLWDQRPLLEANRQLQQIRLYYRFPDADFDRYTLQTDFPAQQAATNTTTPAPQPPPTTEQRQVLIAARELDYSAVPQQAQTWINRHLIYTHGYGFTVSPVNTVGPGGLPEYFVKDISGEAEGSLTTSSPAIRASIPIGKPRIYYGEITDTYVMTRTRTRELDYPSGSDNAYTVYDGQGGVGIGAWWQRWMFAIYLRDWRIVFTNNFLPESKVLFRRNIRQRIQAIAPFLRYDSNPYLVASDTRQPGDTNENHLYWIVDAYTVSDRYPYSDTGSDGVNYIRNSVKVVIDAYHGSVNFYIADPTDPIITTWSAIFPGMFKPLSAMPVDLQRHLRYPVDFFKLQSERLMTYHMTDPQVFYNREDQWQIPTEVYDAEPRPVEPYYLFTSLPNDPADEFLLLLPYTPRQRTNLIAWLAARSDGENYGKLLLYVFPKERLVYGPEQIEARINQDPVISQQISLWNRQGSRAIQGNLLIIPIEQSLLYVEPLYLEASQNSIPTLVRVIVAYENRIVMAPTLEESLQAIFKPEVTPAPAIVRPFEETTPGQ